MPIYEYRCLNCERKFQEIRAIDDHATTCVVCGGELERLFTDPAIFRFRGRNWKPYTVEGAEGPEKMKGEICYAENGHDV